MAGRILCGDARKALDEVADESVHLVLTSPPYNVGIEYDDHDDRQGWEDWTDLMIDVLEKAWAKLVPGGRMVVNVVMGAGRNPLLPVGHTIEGILLDLRGALYRGPVVWYKRGAMGNSSAWGSFNSPSNPVLRGVFEMLYIVSKDRMDRPDRKGEGDLRKGQFMRHALDVWEIAPVTAVAKNHPAPFPNELVRRAVQFYTWPEDHVLDPFAGSGTVGFVSEQLGREWTMIEISKRYCEEIHKRTQIFQGIPTAEIEYI